MTEIRGTLRFILNDSLVELTDISATRTLLDFLRLDRHLRGTKEGCAEGDCGACTVLVGRVSGEGIAYESVNACIAFVGALDGAHVVTIEHLSSPTGPLHPVQQAMVEHHGSQCGFCTPGIVMSLYALWMRMPEPGRQDVEKALQGNLCRCTGYAPIIRAAEAAAGFGRPEEDPLVLERSGMVAKLRALQDGSRIEIGEGRARLIVPSDVEDLARVYAAEPEATLVAGSTDVGLWVTKFMRDIGPLIFIGNLEQLQGIEDTTTGVTLGAGVSYTRAAQVLARRFPQMAELWHRIGGEQVRNMGTIGGNIANGSPIGDTPPPLIALGAKVTLRKGSERRTLKLEEFFIAYGKQDRAPGEFVESVMIPALPAGEQFAVYKISKRREEDISTLCGAFRIFVNDAGTVGMVRIAFGGMAATPKRARAVEAALVGRPWSAETIEAALPAFSEDFQPISDMRASADYRMLTARNLLRRFHLETTGAGQRLERGAA
ncbi:xanthine dehydrogenase small subunit [Arsenicitalea aurantiaca]|uniref:Xanthine dehydrogenase small subunit n=1 Tax=Arsenicitalea aurantiaca TaxID=1783274 RepID=A0A433XLG5_9HYPH|nr:xanthine dehydrogenase small subunit [Arsenicitalea aurantiaca]RUT34927.1 xanthine dehydrogenase small subunit [Arsenicitalea aurantiaca]